MRRETAWWAQLGQPGVHLHSIVLSRLLLRTCRDQNALASIHEISVPILRRPLKRGQPHPGKFRSELGSWQARGGATRTRQLAITIITLPRKSGLLAFQDPSTVGHQSNVNLLRNNRLALLARGGRSPPSFHAECINS